MPDSLNLETIKKAAAALNGHGLTTLEDLRLWIKRDVDKSIPRLAKTSSIAESLLMAFVIAEYCDDTGRSGRQKLGSYWRGLKPFFGFVKLYWIALGQAWQQKKFVTTLGEASWYIPRQFLTRNWRLWYNWRRYWFDFLLIIVLPALLIGLWYRVESAKKVRVQSVTVKPSVKVPAFQRLGDEVQLTSSENVSNGFDSIDKVKGRYSLVALSGGTPVLNDQLLSLELSNKIQNYSIVSIPLKAGTYVRDLSPPGEGTLLLSPRESESASKQHAFDVVVLGVNKNSETVTAILAMRAEDVEKAGALLGSSDAYLTKQAR